MEVTVAEEFWVPFGTALSYFGFQDSIRYEAKAYAKCLDIIDYINMVDYVDQQISLKQFGSKTILMLDSIIKLFSHIVRLLGGS